MSVTGNLDQESQGQISANGLGLMVNGTTTLGQQNNVRLFAAQNNNFLFFNNVGTLVIDTVEVFSGLENSMAVNGITADGVKLSNDGHLSVNRSISTWSSPLLVTTSSGDLSQNDDGNIFAHSLGLMIDGDIRLNGPNQVNVFAAHANGEILFNNTGSQSLNIGTVAIATPFNEMEVAGISTINDDLKIVTDGSLTVANQIQVGNANIFLDVTGSLFQSDVSSAIVANGLGTKVGGVSILDGSNNQIHQIAFDNENQTVFSNTNDLTISTIVVDGMSIVGVSVAGDFTLVNSGSLDQESGIVVTTNSFLTVSGCICLPGVDSDGNSNSDNDFHRVWALSGQSIEIRDANDLNIINVAAHDQIWLQAGVGDSGQLVIEGSISTASQDGQILLQANPWYSANRGGNQHSRITHWKLTKPQWAPRRCAFNFQ